MFWNPKPAAKYTMRPPKLLHQVRSRLRVKHYSIRTEQAYVDWIKRFIWFRGKRHPKDMGAREMEAFLTPRAIEGKVAASMQNQVCQASVSRTMPQVRSMFDGGVMSKLRYSLRAMLATCLVLATGAAAQYYPSQQIRMVVGYAAGGGADGLIRAIAPDLSELMGQPVVVDNRPGGGTVIGTQLVATSKPDGYTLLVADHAYIVNPFLTSKLPYDSLRDLVPVVTFSSSSTTLMVVHPSLPVKTVKELIALAKARPGKLNYSSGGNGTVPHVMGELFKSVAKINLVHIPYKSTGLAIYAATSGEVTIAFGGIFAVKGLVDTGRLRALAIASVARSSLMPAVPTFAEAGWPAIDGTGYRGLLAPAGTPREIIMRLNAGVNKALQLPAVRARLSEVGYVALGGTPEDYGRIIAAETEKWGKIIREAGIKLE